MSAIVRKATGRPLDEFARETLFEPLGITDFEWIRVKGDTDAGGGLRLRPRDMAKIGQLVLAGGRWNGRQIVSKAWIDASMTPRLEATGPYFYGYLWWLGRSLHDGREVHWAAALGRGGQSIRIVPELDLVVVVTAGYSRTTARARFNCSPAFSGTCCARFHRRDEHKTPACGAALVRDCRRRQCPPRPRRYGRMTSPAAALRTTSQR